MNRKFRFDRLYKIAWTMVIIVSIYCLTVGINRYINFPSVKDYYLTEFEGCDDVMAVCGLYLDILHENEEETRMLLSIGFVLPILFFGGKFLINYFYPKKSSHLE